MATKIHTLDVVNAEQDGIQGVMIQGFVPFAAFTAEKAGNTYQLNGETKQATAHRDFNASFEPELVWPDGKIRKFAVHVKANNPESPDEFKTRKESRKQAATAPRKLTREQLLAELAALDEQEAAQ